MASGKDNKTSTGLLVALSSFLAFKMGQKSKAGKKNRNNFSFAGFITFFIVFAFIMAGIQFLIDRPVILAALGVAVALIILCVCLLIRNKKRRQLAKKQAEEEARIKSDEERAKAEKSFCFLLEEDDSPEAQAILKKIDYGMYSDVSSIECGFEICEDSSVPAAKVFLDNTYIGIIHYYDFPLKKVLDNPDRIESIKFYGFSNDEDEYRLDGEGYFDDDGSDEDEYFDDDSEYDDYRQRHTRKNTNPCNVTYSATITFIMK